MRALFAAHTRAGLLRRVDGLLTLMDKQNVLGGELHEGVGGTLPASCSRRNTTRIDSFNSRRVPDRHITSSDLRGTHLRCTFRRATFQTAALTHHELLILALTARD